VCFDKPGSEPIHYAGSSGGADVIPWIDAT